jgi:hypothetical protein
MNGNNAYNGLDMNPMRDFKKDCATYGPASPYCREYLAGWSNGARWIPYNIHIVIKMILFSTELLQWNMWLSDEAHEKVRALGQCGNIRVVSYEMLIGTGAWVAQAHQVRNIPPAASPHMHDIALAAWDKISTGTEYQDSYTKVQQGPTEPFSDFIERLEESIKKQVRGDQTQKNPTASIGF